MNTKLLFVLPLLISCLYGKTQDRISTSINSNWKFIRGEDTSKSGVQNKWASVSIPHTWNANDVMDEELGYYRGVGWYKKNIYLPKAWSQKDVYLYFEAVGQVADVFINGKSVGNHVGSYNAFSFNISPYLNYSSSDNSVNELLVRVDNSHNENIPPLSADFTFYGGIYRDVYLKAVSKVHFDCDNYASSGVFIRTPVVSETKAVLNIKGAFVNGSNAKRNIEINHKIYDAQGNLYAEQKKVYNAIAGQKLAFEQEWNSLKGMHLWSMEDPYLYRIVSTISDASTKEKLDEISNPLGFRWYKFDAQTGFSLNGKPIKLVGASRHQDYKGLGNALGDDMHVQDLLLLKQMGGNFLRIAHYPQDPTILETCDRLGILTSVESPIVNRITETEEFSKNAKDMHLEMIRQHFNHPSLIIWTYMNEVLLMPRYNRGSEQQETYFTAVAKLAKELEAITHDEDSIRYTMIPNHGAWDLYSKVGITKIPKLVGWNLYQGWYSGTLEDFGKFLDKHHTELPDKPLLITEYGSDADIRLHSFKPERFDKTIEYTTLLHQSYLKDMMSRPFVAAALIWNLAEFNSEQRAETTPHINAKGLLTWDRKPKDSYRFYQANLLKTPYLQIGSKEWDKRTGFALSASNLTCTQPMAFFTNQKKVSVSLNGKEIGTATSMQGIANLDIPFVNGLNEIIASSNENGVQVLDHVSIQFQLLSQNLKNTNLPFQNMNISLGDKRYFFDAVAGQTWIPEQEYQPGSWGYVGGQLFTVRGSTRTGYGTTKHLIGSDLDPIFQTQRTGIQQFKMDVPNGTYDLSLLFAELLSPAKANELVYNLGNAAPPEEFKERSFNVSVNGQEILTGFGSSNYLEPLHAITSKHRIVVNNNEGISIDFKALLGESILNGIQVRRVY